LARLSRVILSSSKSPQKDKDEGVVTASSRTIIGNPTPKFSYGMYVNVFYKRFNLSVDVQGGLWKCYFPDVGSLESPYQRVKLCPVYDGIGGTAPGTSNWQPIISRHTASIYNGSNL